MGLKVKGDAVVTAPVSDAERRRSPRVLVDLEVDYASEENYLFAYITDISETGIFVRVLAPGQPMAYYHAEDAQEDFLVLRGECVLVIEGEERRLRAWDFFHCPPWTEHGFVGAGDGPCAILMVGTRSPHETTHYPADPIAGRHGAAVSRATGDPREAYEGRPPSQPAPSPWPFR